MVFNCFFRPTESSLQLLIEGSTSSMYTTCARHVGLGAFLSLMFQKRPGSTAPGPARPGPAL